jgi:diguanylate cyclase (GGDEF)-like protein
MRRELLQDPLTGLGNRRAYEESEKLPIQVSIDLDALKWINDNMGHESGDALLRAMGEALRRVAGTDAYHISGDEFIVQAQTRAKAQWMMESMESASQCLRDAVITAELPDGTIIEKTGIEFSYGYGKNLQDAEAGLREHKAERERQGLRTPRGGEPRGVARSFASESKDKKHTATQAPDTASTEPPTETEAVGPDQETPADAGVYVSASGSEDERPTRPGVPAPTSAEKPHQRLLNTGNIASLSLKALPPRQKRESAASSSRRQSASLVRPQFKAFAKIS